MAPAQRLPGRPTAYQPEFCLRIVELMGEGRSLDGCAKLLGVNPDTLYVWQHRHPAFAEAVRAGRAAATTFWENRLLEVAQGGPGHAQAIIWALRNRSRAASGWHHDLHRVELAGAAEGPSEPPVTIDPTGLSVEQRVVLRQALTAMLQRALPAPGQQAQRATERVVPRIGGA
jgi:hypothetical protein